MTGTELQQWLNAHGAALLADGKPGPQTRLAIWSVFQNTCAAAVTSADISTLAERLGCTVKQLNAVAKVESGGAAFDGNGRPKILFERHHFHRLTGGAHTPAPFSDKKPGGYNEPSWNKLMYAACQDADAAFASASWGKFQVMGFHAERLGYPSAIDMAYSTVTSEAAHYEMLARYIETFGLKGALQALSVNPADNRPFAKGYNGPGYRAYRYDEKLAEAMR